MGTEMIGQVLLELTSAEEGNPPVLIDPTQIASVDDQEWKQGRATRIYLRSHGVNMPGPVTWVTESVATVRNLLVGIKNQVGTPRVVLKGGG